MTTETYEAICTGILTFFTVSLLFARLSRKSEDITTIEILRDIVKYILGRK